MTKAQIKKAYNEIYGSYTDETIVDIDEFADGGIQYAAIISISVNHVVWKRWFYFENGELHFIDSKCL